MYYHPALDGAPSSVSSTVVALASSSVSVFGCVFMLVRLHSIRVAKSRRWHTRHYFVFIMSVANFIASMVAIISGGFFLVYGRIASVAGCTIGGMLELWAQQAVDVCSIITTAAALASLVHNAQWTQKQHWIQTNMAPVFGIIIFLPLVNTIITQIVWRFRSSEFTYCWVPRMPIHARWIAVDGWRVLSVCTILVTYLYMGYKVFRAKRTSMFVNNHSYSSSTYSPSRAPNMLHLSEIDSGVASAASDTRGLFSQSMHNIYWALSKLGRSRGQGLRTKEPHCTADIISIAPSTTRSYYTSFKRSLNTLVRWFHITTDIPSPTISNIFGSMDYDRALSTTQCELCSSRNSHSITISDSYCTDDLHVDMVSYFDGRPRGLRRWCSVLSQLVTRKPPPIDVPQLPVGTRLRRSHTAPVVLRQNMNLCNCVFKRPRDCTQSYNSNGCSDHGVSVCEPQTLTFVHPHDKPYVHDCALSGKVHEMFGHTLQPHMAEPQRVSIYMCANRHINESISSYDTSAHMDKQMPCNNWTHAVARCRSAISNTQPRVSRLYIYPLAHALIYLPYIIYSIASTHVYYSTFSSLGLNKRHDMSGLPAQWTHSDNANRAWPYLQHARGSHSNALYWLAILQALHLLNGGIDALLFWITESQ